MSVLVCVPVYNGFDSVSRCLDALASAQVKDAVPHAADQRRLMMRIRPLLDRYALAHADNPGGDTTPLTAASLERRQAFIAARADEPLCLLNSDTLVTDGWLDAMLECPFGTTPLIGITPFSNNANDLLVDSRARPMAEARGARTHRPKRFAQSPAAAIDLPALVLGFCMLTPQLAVLKSGPFDVELSARTAKATSCMRATVTERAQCGVLTPMLPTRVACRSAGRTRALMKAGAERPLAKHPSYVTMKSQHGSPPTLAFTCSTQVSAILAQG